GERALDAGEAVGDGLEVLEPLDVRVHRLAAGAGPRRADRIGDLHDRRLDAGVFDFLVVGGDAVDHLERQVVALGDPRPDRGVRTLHLVVDGLADVVEQPAHLRDLDVGTDLGRDDRREPARLDDVVEDVLAVARPELQPTQELDDLRWQPRHAGVVGGLLTGLANDQVNFGPCLRDDLLDPAGVDPAVADELRQRQARDLAANGVEARQDDRLGGVVDDQVDAGGLLEGPDVAALAADDPALHLVRRQVHDADGVLRRVIRGDPLDRGNDDVAGLLVGLVAGLPLDRPGELDRVVLGLLADGVEQHRLRVLAGQAAHPLEGGDLLLVGLRQLLARPLDLALAVDELAV